MRRAAMLALLALSGSRTSWAEVCAARAEIDGDRELAARVSDQLRQLGVPEATSEAPGCPPLRAAVVRDPSGAVAVTIRGAGDRIEGRVVDDELVAAVWIDSWLHDDLAAPLWAARAVAPAPRRAGRLDRLAFGAGYEATFSDDSTAWSGVAATVNRQVGPAWLGLRGRFSSQGEVLSATAPTAAARRDLVVLATAAYPTHLGRMSIAPEVGVGLGALSTRRLEGCKPIVPVNCDPTDPSTAGCDPMCPPGGDPAIAYIGDGFATTRFTPRLAGALRIAVPLFDHVWLDGRAAIEAAPGRHAGEYDTAIKADGSAGVPLPGEPLTSYGFAIGLRVGGS
ncbi:MAG: hypothetical protein K8W52_15970 [Deltaproteobacteria bacterium]|nr:hypothetical protein [Deltaproteobacteria bacterium]